MLGRKMCSRFVLLSVLAWTKVVSLDKVSQYDFATVSTSQRPLEINQINDRLSRIEKQLQSQLTEKKESLQMFQNKQIEKTLENLSSVLTHLTNQQTKITQDIQRLEKKIETRLEYVDQPFVDDTRQFKVSKGLPRNCKEVKDRGANISNIYSIQPKSSIEPFIVFCNMDVRGGGWTYVLNRFDGSQPFNLNWTDYKNGFGNLLKEFWLGLEHLHELTGTEVNELLIELIDWDLTEAYAHYSAFIIGKETEGYPLKSLGTYSGNAGDSFHRHVGWKFSTKDKDQDQDFVAGHNCAITHDAGWWYGNCFDNNLTGRYLKGNVTEKLGTSWRHFRGVHYSLKEVRMMIRPRDG